MKPKLRTMTAMGGLVALSLWTLFAQAQSKSSATTATVATVGPLKITRQDLEQRARVAHAEYQKRYGSTIPDEVKTLLDRHVLESLIRANLLRLEAQRRKVDVSDVELEAQLRAAPFFQQNGTFNQARYVAFKTNNPAGFRQALQNIRNEVAARRLNDKVQAQCRPEDAKVRASAERALSRASVEFLALRRAEFSGEFTEPRETEILAYYQGHMIEFNRPPRAVLTMIEISATSPDSLKGNTAETRTWEARIRQRADSTLAALKSGASFDEVAESLGGPLRNVVVIADNFPGYWQGDARQKAQVFRQSPGTFLSEPVPARSGWLLVRVDEVRNSRVAPLREVSAEIRKGLRDDIRLHHDELALRAMYEARRDSLRRTAYRVRYAVADTGTVNPGEPSAAELDHYYRGHLADYTTYDAASGSISSKPFAVVANDVRSRWLRDRRITLAKSLGENLVEAWSRGRRDRALERSAALIRDVGPLPSGALIDSGAAGRVLSDSLAHRGMDLGVGIVPFDRGVIVFHVHDRIPNFTPSFGQIRLALSAERAETRKHQEEEDARAQFEKHPERFLTGQVIYFTRLMCRPPSVIDVPLTREEVASYHRQHFDKYSTPELVHARHILVSPTGPGAEADEAARRKATDLLRRIRSGEDFAQLARDNTEDPATQDEGGDLGFFGRGTMLDAFERAAFSLHPGEVSDLVKTEVGYHIIKVLDHQSATAEPLEQLYSTVGSDLAQEKGKRIARHLADSLYHRIRAPSQARAAAKKLGLRIGSFTHVMGDRNYPDEQIRAFERLERLKPGEIYPGVESLPAFGSFIQWVDSIGPPTRLTWTQARAPVIEAYRRDAGKRALETKRQELDSLMSAGWSFDSLAALWSGPEKAELTPAKGLPGLGGIPIVDSLAFGKTRGPALKLGEVSDWIDLPRALVRMRIRERIKPSPTQLASKIESERRLILEYNLSDYFDALKKRYPVDILEPSLRGVALPPLPEPSTL